MPDPLRCLCELAKEWLDPTKIPVEEIAEEWRSQSKRGRYKAAMWRTAGLEEPTVKAGCGELGCEVAEGAALYESKPAQGRENRHALRWPWFRLRHQHQGAQWAMVREYATCARR